jgi:hypothetical protein
MHFLYEGDYDFGLESAQLMSVVVRDLLQHLELMESTRRSGDSTER